MQQSVAMVYILDDEPEVQRALERLIRSTGYEAQVSSSAEALLSIEDPERAGCIILDFNLASLKWNGLEVQAALSSLGRERPVVFLSGRANIATSVAALRAGAVDFLTKPVNERRLLEAVREAIALDSERWRAKRALSIIEERLERLTPRERQVLEHVVSGQYNKQIAADLGTHEKTIKVHRGRVMRKMGVRSVAELVQLACSAGIAPPEVRGVLLSRASLGRRSSAGRARVDDR